MVAPLHGSPGDQSMRQNFLAAVLMCGVVVGCSDWGSSQRSSLPLSEIEETCTPSSTPADVRFTVKTGSGEYSGSNQLPDGTTSAVGGWTSPGGLSGPEASAISNITMCAESYTGTIKGTETVPTGCVRTTGGQHGENGTVTFGDVTIQFTSWTSKDGKTEGDYVQFSFVVCGSDPGGSAPGGTDPGGSTGGTDPGGSTGGTDPGGSTGGEEPVN